MEIETAVVGSYAVNCYLAWDARSGQGIIVDPGDDGPLIAEAVSQLGFKPVGILLTHGHLDHIGAVRELMEKWSLPLYAGRNEVPLLIDPEANMSALTGHPRSTPEPDFLLDDEQPFRMGPLEFRALATPGHSPGGICILHETSGTLFCGDTLFAGSIGRTDFPGCSHQQLIKSIEEKILTLPDSIVCLPGHGPQTTVGAERVNNPFLQGGYFV
ncbi:MAG: MBL fold metallo-hydrolase [bacterium]|nr:MBL fold metallo-hydrolase [bacterium]